MTLQDTFIERLRRYRERQQISLEHMAGVTRIKRDALEAFERNDLSGWPRGLYARAWIRAYANMIGLDPIDTVDEFCRLFPHGDRRAGGMVQEIAAIVAHPSEYRDEFSVETDRRRTLDLGVGSGSDSTKQRGLDSPLLRAVPARPTMIARAAQVLWMRLAALTVPSAESSDPSKVPTRHVGRRAFSRSLMRLMRAGYPKPHHRT